MNRSCFDRKRFAVLLHEDWAARRTRCLVTLAAGYLLLSAILTVSCLKAYSENATLLQTVPTDILEDKFAHLTDTATNQNAAFPGRSPNTDCRPCCECSITAVFDIRGQW